MLPKDYIIPAKFRLFLYQQSYKVDKKSYLNNKKKYNLYQQKYKDILEEGESTFLTLGCLGPQEMDPISRDKLYLYKISIQNKNEMFLNFVNKKEVNYYPKECINCYPNVQSYNITTENSFKNITELKLNCFLYSFVEPHIHYEKTYNYKNVKALFETLIEVPFINLQLSAQSFNPQNISKDKFIYMSHMDFPPKFISTFFNLYFSRKSYFFSLYEGKEFDFIILNHFLSSFQFWFLFSYNIIFNFLCIYLYIIIPMFIKQHKNLIYYLAKLYYKIRFYKFY